MAYESKYKIRSIPHLRTGLNDRYDPSEIADTDMASCENIEVDTRSIKNAGGYVNYGGDTGPFFGGFNAKFEGGTTTMIRQRGTVLEYDNGGGTWTECTLPTSGSPATTISLTETVPAFAMLNDIVLFSNGTDSTMSSTDGITWTIPTTGSPAIELPKAKVLFNNGTERILFMGVPLYSSLVYWSNINDPLTVESTAFQFIGKNDGQEIIDAVLMPSGGMLLFKTNRFYSISDITFDMTAVDPIGEAPCVRHTAVATENSAMWAGPDGRIYEFDGQKANIISDNIAPLNITRSDVMRAVYHNYNYRLAIPNGSDAFNSYELVVNRKILTEQRFNPYVITKNQRYIGCYIPEDRTVSSVRRRRLYFGDGRSDGVGSPAEVPTTFAYINDIHDTGITQGLNGVAQTCSVTTKFFTEDVPFFIKRYVKYFSQVKSTLAQDITVSYRFDPNGQWSDSVVTSSPADLDFEFGDGTTGGFDEGYSFSFEATENIIRDLETTGADLRGIQFKLTWTSIVDVEVLNQAFKFLIKPNLH